jgi:hypothetical protein
VTLRGFRDEALGVALTIDERFLDVGSASDGESPSERWDAERVTLELPFRTLELI